MIKAALATQSESCLKADIGVEDEEKREDAAAAVSMIRPNLSPSHFQPLSASHLLFLLAKFKIPLTAVISSSGIGPF